MFVWMDDYPLIIIVIMYSIRKHLMQMMHSNLLWLLINESSLVWWWCCCCCFVGYVALWTFVLLSRLLSLRQGIVDIRNSYSVVYDKIRLNLDSIMKPKGVLSDVHWDSLYWWHCCFVLFFENLLCLWIALFYFALHRMLYVSKIWWKLLFLFYVEYLLDVLQHVGIVIWET